MRSTGRQGEESNLKDFPKRRGARRVLRAPVLESLASHASVGMFLTDARGRAHYLSAQACRIIGLPREQALGDGWLTALHPDDERRVLRGRKRAIARGAVYRGRFRFLRRDGRVVWAEAVAVPHRDARGRLLGRVGMVRDITSQVAKPAAAPTASGDALSPQERRILELVVDGKTNKQIARTLSLSAKTVKNYLSNAYQKLHVARRSQAAALFARLAGEA